MSDAIKVAELFAGVGGFRLGLEGFPGDRGSEWDYPAAGPYKTIWANQWEPPGTERRQFAWRCYEARFGNGSCVNEDINKVLDEYENGKRDIPDVDMVVGGFPCQDYSVARPLSSASGIEGKKGVLWWDIYRFLRLKQPKLVLLENVDRLLKSPASQRGRDFAIMLSCLASLGYCAEWQVVNSAEYGFPERRKRVYIFAAHTPAWDGSVWNCGDVISEAFPIEKMGDTCKIAIPLDPYDASETFNKGGSPKSKSPFRNRGVLVGNTVLTCDVLERYDGEKRTLGDVLVSQREIPEEYYIPQEQIPQWEYLKGSKHEERVARNGHHYFYSEGKMSFPDSLDKPSRTILTGEGGRGASRFKHVVQCSDGRLRRLVPDELDRLQGFPAGWTDTGMTDGNRAFCMGNALVVGIPHRIGKVIAKRIRDAN